MSYALTFLVLSAAVSLSGPETIAAFEAAYPGRLPYIQEIEKGPNKSIVFDVKGSRVIVGYTTDPLSPDIYEHALETVESWQAGRKAFQQQAAYIVVGLDEKADNHKELEAGATAVTLVAGALAAKLPVSAALFADGELVVEPQKLRERAAQLADKGDFPIDLWVSINPFYLEDERGKKTPTVITWGLKPFVGREIEFSSDQYSFDQLMQRVSDFSLYLIKKGPIVQDGHTIGNSATERIRVRHLKSGLSGAPALSLSLEKSDPALSPR